MSDIGEKIYNLRKQKGMTLEELGNKVGVGKSTVRKWETGLIANMRRDKIELIADALDVSPSYLMGWEDSDAPSAPLSDPDAPFIAKYKRLDHEDKTRVQERVDTLLEQDKYQKGFGAEQVG